MRFMKVLTILISLNILIISGCGGGGGGGGDGGKSASLYGIDIRITYPDGTTLVNVVKSGITPASYFLNLGTIGSTATIVNMAGTEGIGSGEVMKVNFSTVPQGSIPANFGASVLSAFDSNGVPLQAVVTASISTVINPTNNTAIGTVTIAY
jgi:hypothetical protein